MNKKVLTPPPEEPENDVLTPKAPSIAFPLANPAVAPEPQVKGSKFALTTTREALIWSKWNLIAQHCVTLLSTFLRYANSCMLVLIQLHNNELIICTVQCTICTSLSSKVLVLKGCLFFSGEEGRKTTSQISAVLPQPPGAHWLQSPHRGAWWVSHLISDLTLFHRAAVQKAAHQRLEVRGANPWWL